MPVTMPSAWSEADYQLVRQLEQQMNHRAIGARYGISRNAVMNRLRRWRQRTGDTRQRDPRLLTPRQVAQALGCSLYTVHGWRKDGALVFPLRHTAGWPACIIRDVLDFLERGYALAPVIQPPPTELFWYQAVARIRRDLDRRWVHTRALCAALYIHEDTLSHWRRQGFPRCTINFGHYGCYADRQAVIAWLNQWPTKYTKAAKRLLEEQG